jgi:hypothetical protein
MRRRRDRLCLRPARVAISRVACRRSATRFRANREWRTFRGTSDQRTHCRVIAVRRRRSRQRRGPGAARHRGARSHPARAGSRRREQEGGRQATSAVSAGGRLPGVFHRTGQLSRAAGWLPGLRGGSRRPPSGRSTTSNRPRFRNVVSARDPLLRVFIRVGAAIESCRLASGASWRQQEAHVGCSTTSVRRRF